MVNIIELRKAMYALNITTGKLAEILGVSRSTVARRLAGNASWRKLEEATLKTIIAEAKVAPAKSST